jgi:two-component system chemotaxis sensor kinase CheA
MIDLDPVETFRQEAAELLDSLEAALLDLAENLGDGALIDTAFRALHTIKGSGAMFGFDRVAAFTHDFETAFDRIRKGEAAATAEIAALSLEAKDHIRQLIEDPIGTDGAVGERIVGSLQALLGSGRPAGEGPATPAPEAKDSAGWRIVFSFGPDSLRNGANPLAMLDDLRALGPCEVVADLSGVPPLEDLDPEVCHVGWTVTLRAPCPIAAIEDVFMFVRDEMSLSITALDEAPAAAPAPAAEAAPEPERPAAERPDALQGRKADDRNRTVRIQAERLDELMDRVGELVIAQARLSQLAHHGGDTAVKTVAEEIERLAAALRDTTMGVRMVPIGALFGRFRRLVHDLSRDLGKPVDFVTVGEETELDKTMIERLADPLVHLIRNAIDHGIEKPERRAAAGKAASGRIELTARHVGAQVLVTVKDDGGGLDTARIRAKAEEQGLIQPGATLSDQEIHQFLFHPGFSTAATVSALSGRGVGMDVVKRTIEAMRGVIDIATEPGRGSTITLRLPLTLAIIDGLLIRVGAEHYIIPLSAVEECVELTANDEARARGRDFLTIRGALVPFLRLRDQFGAGGEPDPYPKVIITTVGDTRVGLVVDQIVGSHQTVIKSLTKLHADVAMFSGATILGDGSAALILDVAQLVDLVQTRNDRDRLAEAA